MAAFRLVLQDSHVMPGLMHKLYLANSTQLPSGSIIAMMMVMMMMNPDTHGTRVCHCGVAENNTDFVVWGTGKPLRQFIFALDLARLMIWFVLSLLILSHRRCFLLSSFAIRTVLVVR
jgi:hypothetical protein